MYNVRSFRIIQCARVAADRARERDRLKIVFFSPPAPINYNRKLAGVLGRARAHPKRERAFYAMLAAAAY